MGRELRKVPAGWEHPKKDNGSWQPMYDEYYGDAFNRWLDNHIKWIDGSHHDLLAGIASIEDYPFYALWDGNPPDVEYYQISKYMPEELTHIQLYETTSEGTPCTPVFPADQLEQLCEYAATHCSTFADFKATKEQWMNMLKNDFVHHTEGNVTFL